MPRYSLIRRFVSLMLATLVLTTSVGLTVQRNTCRMSGRSQVQLSVPGQATLGGCAGERGAARPVAKDGCCDLSSHLHKLSTPVHELAAKTVVPTPLLAACMPAAVWELAPVAPASVAATQCWFGAYSSPPPLGGRGLLAFACTLVV
jgi:hypothetical protein